MRYRYIEYTPAMEHLVEPWIDEDVVRFAGFENGVTNYYEYWKHDPHTVLGENFWMKVISENDQPIGIVALGFADGVLSVLEFVIDPAKRGNGIGTAVLKDLLANGKDIVGFPIDRAEACIFQSNLPSQKAFQKAGFRLDPSSPDGDAWEYLSAR